MRLTVIGCGHLGAVQAACLAEIGHEVLGLDTDPTRIGVLRGGRAWFHEPGLDDLLTRKIRAGRLHFTTSFAEAAKFSAVHLLSVATPALPDDDGYDLSQVFAAATSLAARITRPALLIGRSTVPPGTAGRVTREVAAATSRPVEVAWVPEFMRAGRAIQDFLTPARIVAGVPSAEAEKTIRELYWPLTRTGVPLLVTDVVTAELCKLASNVFLAAKLSLINVMDDLCAASGADIGVLSDAVGLDPRIGADYLEAGLGYGGGCLPHDVRGLAGYARDRGATAAAQLIGAVDEANTARRQLLTNRVVKLAGPLRGKRVAIWGAAFKPGTDDVRDSPGLDVADRLARHGAEVVVYDPAATTSALMDFPHLSFADSALAAAHNADVVVVVTAWHEFDAINPAAAGAAVRKRLLVDACQAIRAPHWQAAGWTVA